MSGANRVFIARLTGTEVFDPNGDQVGKVRDVVVALRVGGQAPRVVGMVVEVPPRRRIFVPMTRVTSINPGTVVITGLLNMRRFEQRTGETLVIGELLDRSVTLLEDGASVVIEDVAMEPTRTRDWVVSRVHVMRKPSGLRRRGPTLTVAWDEVSGLALAEAEQGVTNLLATITSLRAPDVAALMHDLSAKRRLEIASALDDERLADVLEEMGEADRVAILADLESERAADVLGEMDPDDAADLLREVGPETAARLLELMDSKDAEDVRRLMTYEDYSAGGMMTTEPLILPPDATVAEALALVRMSELSPALASQVYVCRTPTETPTGRYIGMAHFQRLLREPPATLIGAVVDKETEPLSPTTTLSEVTSYLATYNLVAIPVVDSEDRLLGAVTVDDVLDHLLPERWRDQELGSTRTGA
jgi:Mg/Co/Ni transporter MgtE